MSVSFPVDAVRLPEKTAGRLTTFARSVSLLAILVAAVAALTRTERFAYAYLTGFVWLVTLSIGALFFVLLQHVTRAGWSVAARRHMEWLSSALPVCGLLFVPLLALARYPYHDWMGPDAMAHPLLQKKQAYLNVPFFVVRAVVFFVAWTLLSRWFYGTSRAQDDKGDAALTTKMQAASGPSIVVLALTTTFAGFDWLMSLQPEWYSTIFGVYVFAGSMVSSLSALALITVALQRADLLRRVSTVEHRHDIGKLLFGFTVFWAYIAFSQYFLIWYANLPEETVFFRLRMVGSWGWVSLALVFGHFVVPFLLLLSRTAKRNMIVLGGTAVLLLVMHYVDLYWIIMPGLDASGVEPSWVDLAGVLPPIGALLFVLSREAARGPLFPTGDPRLAEAVQLENL